jgi:flagellar assembly factor FliW
MLIESTSFGELHISDQEILHFPHGLPGFPREKEFAFLPHDTDSPFAFLQSVADPDLTFTIVAPFDFFQDYSFDLDDQIAEELDITGDNPPEIWNIVTVPQNIAEMTTNLLAPVIVNRLTRQARQIVLEKTAYTTRHRLFPQGLPNQSEKGGK